ncbi:DUF4209 domain-containing protein [Psychrobacter sp. T6-5]|uniref:DUF4209 domain-containing protein n=1 Tax=Psychrobacter sp. T6-5 TaxID=3457451 RepID=UPI003FD05BFF
MTSDNDVKIESNALKILQRIIDKNEDRNLDRLASIIERDLKENEDGIKTEDRNLLRLLSNSASMSLTPESNNEPFKASIIWQDGKRSALPSDFSPDDLNILSDIVNNINYLPLKARVFDLLWVSGQSNKYTHARNAVNCYVGEDIGCKKLSEIGIKELERAYRLSKQINYKEKLIVIEQYLYNALYSEPDTIIYSIADLTERTESLRDKVSDIALRLEELGFKFKESQKFNNAIRHFELSAKYHERDSSQEKRIFTLVQVAECYAKDADIHFNSGQGRKLMSSSLFESAIRAYRQVPNKFRERYSVDDEISRIRHKLRDSRINIVNRMMTFSLPFENPESFINEARNFVANSETEYEAFCRLSNICKTPDYEALKENEIEKMRKYFFSSFAEVSQYSSNGRMIAKIPATGSNDSKNNITLDEKMISFFGIYILGNVKLSIIPALRQILSEHTISKSSIFSICNLSPVVPKSNIDLISHAIWLGFELDFSTAIHLVAPQMELIVRNQLQSNGVHTAQLHEDGIEHEKGLSALLDMKECNEILGKDNVFELKAVFASSSGPNLRNEVAHGLITDDSAQYVAPVYAWWMLFRMVMHSITIPAQNLDSE